MYRRFEQSVCRPQRSGRRLQMETMFLRLKGPVTVGSYFGHWRVTWAGGWARDKLFLLVMVATTDEPQI